MIIEAGVLLVGVALLVFSSNKTVELASGLAKELGISPFLVGVLVLAAGTSLPEIANSITSSYAGHGDINVGNALGSCLSQITLILGIIAIVGGKAITGSRKDIMLLGGCALLAGVLAVLTVEKGYIDRMDAIFLIGSYFMLLFITQKYSVKDYVMTHLPRIDKEAMVHALMLLIAMGGVLVGSWMIVDSVIILSAHMDVPEYLLSFFLVAIGTSLPELTVGLSAIRRERFELVIGNIFGSNIADATISIASGPLLFPNAFDAGLATVTGEYMIIASFIVVALFAWRTRLGPKLGLLFIALYLLSLLFLPLYG